jgi:hypothetical protein
MSKEGADKTLSVLFQDNFSGRAEIGLTGDDNFHFKMSPDGTSWTEALVIDRDSGRARVQGLDHALTGAPHALMLFTPGGDGTVSFWRVDASSGQNPRAATISSISGDTITLTANVASQFFYQMYMHNVSYVRIWNTSKIPNESAWVQAQPAANQLQVLTASDISSWTNGETIQVGDPIAITPNRCIALDISPMMQNVLGTVFRQSGIMVKGGMQADSALDAIALSATGATGSFFATAQCYVPGAFQSVGTVAIPCSELSPVSNSNLVFLRETIASTAQNRLVSAVAVFG